MNIHTSLDLHEDGQAHIHVCLGKQLSGKVLALWMKDARLHPCPHDTLRSAGHGPGGPGAPWSPKDPVGMNRLQDIIGSEKMKVKMPTIGDS